jgi:hypothetical protein
MTSTPDTIRVFIPLTIRRRNGRPRILPPANMEAAEPRTQDPHVLRAIACAWGWRRQIETGAVATIHDIAVDEKVSERFVSRTMRLAYLSPIVLERLVAQRRPCSLSIKDLIAAAERPWCEQEALVFENLIVTRKPGLAFEGLSKADIATAAG